MQQFPSEYHKLKAQAKLRPSGSVHHGRGEQLTLTIASTLMGNPLFVLLDEPSEGVAPVIVEQMAKVISQLKTEGLTILLSEQNLQFAQVVADRAVIIESGEQKFAGTLDELNAQPYIRDAYLAA